jgi:type I restriction enzyme S subunit
VDEQAMIADFIDQSAQGINDRIAHVEREIALIREYRTRLIADVVTGKLDVREAAVGLPDEADEPAMLEEVEALAEGDEDEDSDAGLEEAEG